MVRVKLSTRILLYFLFVAIFTQFINNYLLVSSANKALLDTAGSKQQAIAGYLSENVENYLNNNLYRLRYMATMYAAESTSSEDITRNMALAFAQNKDLHRLAIVDKSGMEQIVFNEKGLDNRLSDASDSDAFKAIKFLAGKNFISSVSSDGEGGLDVTIATPILASNFDQDLGNIKDANLGTYQSPDDIVGAVIADYSIEDLWKTVLSTEVGDGGYAYIVDTVGNLVAHPDASRLADKDEAKILEVEAFQQMVNGNFSTAETVSETGEQVVSTPKIIPNSGWALIVQEPKSRIYSSANDFIWLAVAIGLFSATVATILSIYFGRRLTKPINKLTLGAEKIGAGDFEHRININSGDEFQSLADAFNSMGNSTQKLVEALKNNNDQLTAETAKLDNIISSTTDGIIALRNDGSILSINPPAAKLANQKIEAIIGKQLKDVFKWERNDGEALELNLSKSGTSEYSEITLRHEDQIAFLDLVVAVLDSSSGGVACIITIHDLTKSRELEFMKLDFVAIAAHELRTPLTVVRGYLDLLNSDATKQLSIMNVENIQKTIRATDELRNLINKLLNIARIERGDMEIFIEKMDLNKHSLENVHQHLSTATQNEQRLKFKTQIEGPAYVPADPSSVTEVLNNLIGNAIKYTGRGGEIYVELSVEGDQVRVEISDNGPGIPNELHSKLFTKFYRAERSLIAGTKGTGLGLFISRTIVELQGGKIGIMPAAEKGSRFFFTLPLYNPEIHEGLVHKHKQPGGVHGWFKKNSDRRR